MLMQDLLSLINTQNRWVATSGMITHDIVRLKGPDLSFSQMLAELMLPDQVHNREEDWTIFFLHKGPDEGEPDGEAGLMYVLSLVNKKLDQNVKR